VSDPDLDNLAGDARRVLVTDFDGTFSRRDFLHVIRAMTPPDWPDPFDDFLRGRVSHFEAISRCYSAARSPRERWERAALETDPHPDCAAAIDRLRASGWAVVIVSAGCRWYIDRILQARGIRVPVIANEGEVDVDGVLRMRLDPQSPFHCPWTGVDKARVVGLLLEQGRTVAFAGDGRPDLAAALAVPPHLRFARNWLAEELARRGEPFILLERWPDVAPRLIGATHDAGPE